MAKRQNGEGTVKKRSDGRYEAQVIVGIDPLTGKQRRKSVYGKTPEDVIRKKDQLAEQVRTNQLVMTEKITLGEWMDRWLKHYVALRVRGTTYDNYEVLIRRHIIPLLGKMYLQKIRSTDVQRLYAQKMMAGRADNKEGGLSAKTIKEIHNILNRAFKDAVKAEVVVRNPVENAMPPKKIKHEITPMSPQQVQKFLNVAQSDKLYVAFLLEFNTGLRRGELLGLRWKDVDLDSGVIRVLQSVVSKKGVPTVQLPKTESSKRTIPLTRDLIVQLKLYREAQAVNEYNINRLLFSQPNGQPLNPRGFTRKFHSLLMKAKLPYFRFHDCRHTVATMLLSLSVHPKVAQSILGHSDIETTINTYSHLTPGLDTKAINKLGKLLNTRKPSPDNEEG